MCGVCDQHLTKAFLTSALSPFLIGYCENCLQRHAEPLWLLVEHLDGCDGPEHAASWMKGLRSYVDGGYIEWDEIGRIWHEQAARRAPLRAS